MNSHSVREHSARECATLVFAIDSINYILLGNHLILMFSPFFALGTSGSKKCERTRGMLIVDWKIVPYERYVAIINNAKLRQDARRNVTRYSGNIRAIRERFLRYHAIRFYAKPRVTLFRQSSSASPAYPFSRGIERKVYVRLRAESHRDSRRRTCECSFA